MSMRIGILLLIGLFLVGCEAQVNVGQPSEATDDTWVEGTELPLPPPGTPRKAIASTWTRTDNRYTADLAQHTAYPWVGRYAFVFGGSATCAAFVEWDGTNDNGRLTIREARSTDGSQTKTSVYCDPLEGSYDYAAIADGRMRLCRKTTPNYGVCVYWQ